MTITNEQIIEQLKNPEDISEAKWIEIAENFPTEAEEKDQDRILESLLTENGEEYGIPGIMNKLLKILINNPKVPFEKLREEDLFGIAAHDITDVNVFFSGLKRFKSNDAFIGGMLRNDILYPEFIKIYNKEISDFNDELEAHMESLKAAETTDDIDNIKVKVQILEQKRYDLLEKYPEKALPEKSKPEDILLKLDELKEAVTIVDKKINVRKDVEEKRLIYSQSRDTNAWGELKAARRESNRLSMYFHDKYYKQPKAKHTL